MGRFCCAVDIRRSDAGGRGVIPVATGFATCDARACVVGGPLRQRPRLPYPRGEPAPPPYPV
jgi:hypothetical protein